MPKVTKAYIAEIKQILIEARAKAYKAVNYAMVEAYWLIGKRIVEEIQQGKNRANYGDQAINNVSKALTDEFGRGYSARTIRQCRQFYQTFPKFSIKRSLIAVSAKSVRKKVNCAITDASLRSASERKLLNNAARRLAHRTIKTTKSKTNLAITDASLRSASEKKLLNNAARRLAHRQIQAPELQHILNWTHIQRIMRVSDPQARAWYLKETAEQSWDVRTLDRNISTLFSRTRNCSYSIQRIYSYFIIHGKIFQ